MNPQADEIYLMWLWNKLIKSVFLSKLVGALEFESYVKPSSLAAKIVEGEETIFVLHVPNERARQWIEENLREHIEACIPSLHFQWRGKVRLEICIQPSIEDAVIKALEEDNLDRNAAAIVRLLRRIRTILELDVEGKEVPSHLSDVGRPTLTDDTLLVNQSFWPQVRERLEAVMGIEPNEVAGAKLKDIHVVWYEDVQPSVCRGYFLLTASPGAVAEDVLRSPIHAALPGVITAVTLNPASWYASSSNKDAKLELGTGWDEWMGETRTKSLHRSKNGYINRSRTSKGAAPMQETYKNNAFEEDIRRTLAGLMGQGDPRQVAEVAQQMADEATAESEESLKAQGWIRYTDAVNKYPPLQDAPHLLATWIKRGHVDVVRLGRKLVYVKDSQVQKRVKKLEAYRQAKDY